MIRVNNHDTFIFSEKHQNVFGGQTILINKSKEITITTPFLPSYTGIYQKNLNKTSIDFHVTDEVKLFFDELDKKVLCEAIHNDIAWFGKSLSESEVRSMFQPTVNHNNILTCKIQVYPNTDRFIGNIYNNDRQLVDNYSIQNMSVASIIKLTGVYFIPRKFGLSLKVLQMKTRPLRNELNSYAFVDESDVSDAEPN
jgi:hypothetical protein